MSEFMKNSKIEELDHLPNDIVGVEDILLALLEVLAKSVVVDEAPIPGSVVLEVDSPLAAKEGGMSSGQDLKCISNQFVLQLHIYITCCCLLSSSFMASKALSRSMNAV